MVTTTTTTTTAARSTASIQESSSSSPSFCFLRVSIAGDVSRTIVIQLFVETCPTICRNFTALLVNSGTTSRSTPRPCYRGTEFHRIVDGFMVQGGDFENFDGSGGYAAVAAVAVGASAGCDTSDHRSKAFLPDESLGAILHDRPGRVSMANRGPNTNGSQFFITLAPVPHLDAKHACFGQVVSGMSVVHDMTKVERERRSRPVTMQKIVVTDCGMGDGRSVRDTSDSSSSAESERKKKKDKKKKQIKKTKKKSKRHRKRDEDSSYERHKRKKRKRSHRHDEYSTSGDSSEETESRKRRRT